VRGGLSKGKGEKKWFHIGQRQEAKPGKEHFRGGEEKGGADWPTGDRIQKIPIPENKLREGARNRRFCRGGGGGKPPTLPWAVMSGHPKAIFLQKEKGGLAFKRRWSRGGKCLKNSSPIFGRKIWAEKLSILKVMRAYPQGKMVGGVKKFFHSTRVGKSMRRDFH